MGNTYNHSEKLPAWAPEPLVRLLNAFLKDQKASPNQGRGHRIKLLKRLLTDNASGMERAWRTIENKLTNADNPTWISHFYCSLFFLIKEASEGHPTNLKKIGAADAKRIGRMIGSLQRELEKFGLAEQSMSPWSSAKGAMRFPRSDEFLRSAKLDRFAPGVALFASDIDNLPSWSKVLEGLATTVQEHNKQALFTYNTGNTDVHYFIGAISDFFEDTIKESLPESVTAFARVALNNPQIGLSDIEAAKRRQRKILPEFPAILASLPKE
ncbi:MAG: hypothetical protein V2J55_19225 [Candidatus Competibacteraceae bacterium]|nr:hypothetical protein [Candidatus Competibacteraceae bacterium]